MDALGGGSFLFGQHLLEKGGLETGNDSGQSCQQGFEEKNRIAVFSPELIPTEGFLQMAKKLGSENRFALACLGLDKDQFSPLDPLHGELPEKIFPKYEPLVIKKWWGIFALLERGWFFHYGSSAKSVGKFWRG
ncbi:hypothetical protein ACHHRT_10890 [Desulfurivibrio sp. D14AmB]|uniref:hypothetical protein n=1 Tax=Desulfurivibrio sp. D14AmB TaxID=3374370 RepID=UPI00376EE45F